MKTREVTTPSGETYIWHRVPRHVHWRHGRAAQTLQAKLEQASGDGLSESERGLVFLESLSPEEAAKLEAYINDVLSHGLPGMDVGELSEEDYWYLYGQSVHATPNAKVETTEGEVTVEAVETFPPKSELSPVGAEV